MKPFALAAALVAAATLLLSSPAHAQQPPPPLIIPSALPPIHIPGLWPPPTPEAGKTPKKPTTKRPPLRIPRIPPLILPAKLPPLPQIPGLPPIAPSTSQQCPAPTNLPAVRRSGGLTVESPARPMRPQGGTRLRTHTDGPLGDMPGRVSPRFWAGIEVPLFVPISMGRQELFLLDPIDAGYLALYREPYGGNSCQLGDSVNCAYEVRIFDCNGRTLSTLDLNAFMSRRAHLEVADVRFADGIVYFNEACQSYSWEAGGRCSSLVAVDSRTSKLVWRTAPRISNNVLLVKDGYVITGYGFTGESSALFLVSRNTGLVVHKSPLGVRTPNGVGGNHDALTLLPGDTLRVGLYESDRDLLFRLDGFDGKRPSLTRLGTL